MSRGAYLPLVTDKGKHVDCYVARDGALVEAWDGAERIADATVLADLAEQIDIIKVNSAWQAIDVAAAAGAQ